MTPGDGPEMLQIWLNRYNGYMRYIKKIETYVQFGLNFGWNQFSNAEFIPIGITSVCPCKNGFYSK